MCREKSKISEYLIKSFTRGEPWENTDGMGIPVSEVLTLILPVSRRDSEVLTRSHPVGSYVPVQEKVPVIGARPTAGTVVEPKTSTL